MERNSFWYVTTVLSLFGTLSAAQAQAYKYPYGTEGSPVLDKTYEQRTRDELRDFLDPNQNALKLALFAMGPEGHRLLIESFEATRIDKQTGSTSDSGGTTSLASKGAVPAILGLAVENGALARTTEETVATYRGNALGIARLIAGADQYPYCSVLDSCPATRLLGGLSFHVAFDASRGDTTSMPPTNNEAVLTGDKRQISGWGIRYSFDRRKKLLDRAYSKRLTATQTFIKRYFEISAKPEANRTEEEKKLIDDHKEFFARAGEATKAVADLIGILGNPDNDRYLHSWYEKYIDMLRSADAVTERQLKQILAEAAEELIEIARELDPTFDDKVESLLMVTGAYFGERDKAYEEARPAINFAFEYVNARPMDQPSQSTFRSIVSSQPGAKTQISLNAAFTFYSSKPPEGSVGRWRDAQVALQVDRRLGVISKSVLADLSGGYYYQYMADNALLELGSEMLAPGTTIPLPGEASVLLGTKGHIHIGQIKLSFSLKDTGVQFPIALTFASRTELIDANEVRGNFGITFDLDRLLLGKK